MYFQNKCKKQYSCYNNKISKGFNPVVVIIGDVRASNTE